jgi:hypothetical protein
VALRTILRRLQSPLFQAGDLAFDCEVEVRRGGRATFTKTRVAAGVNMSDHSFDEPEEFTITAAVSGITQIQNLGRPGQSFLGAAIGVGLDQLEALTGIDFSTRVADFEARLRALLRRREVLEIVSKVVGRRQVVMTSWDATTDAGTGDAAFYLMQFEEVLRAEDLAGDPTDVLLDLVGSGGKVAPGSGGPSLVTPGNLATVP